MTTTAGPKGGSKRSWQGTERPAFDEQSHKVWRGIITVLALALLGAAAYYLYELSRTPPKALLVSITDDRSEYATVPPVPMVPGDDRGLIGWARAAKVPTLRATLELKIDEFMDRITSPNADVAKFTLMDESGDSAKGQFFSLAKRDTLIFYLRGHGVAAPVTGEAKPQPLLVTRFEGLKELTDANTISVKHLLERLAEIPDVRKLVILDAVHFNYDPRLGQLTNQFPSAVASVMPEKAENLWVILPTSNGELTAAVPHFERTLFNLAFVDALQAENHNGAKHAPLPKLVEHLNTRYHEILNLRADLEFWQTMTILPSRDEPENAARFARSGSTMLIPTTPVPKKPKAEKEAKAAEKKTAAEAPRGTAGPWPTSLAMGFQQPPGTAAPMPAAAPGNAPSAPAEAAKNGAAPPSSPASPMSQPMPATARAGADPAAPMAKAPPAPAPAPPDPYAEPQYNRDVTTYRAKLAQAWQLRDEIELWDASNRPTWSPVHFTPALWREMNARLVSHEERLRAGDLGNAENDLNALLPYLQDLRASLQEDESAGGWKRDSEYGLLLAWQRFRFGESKIPSRAWQSFQASEGNALHNANRALKIYADCAYRLPEYAHLQGLLLSAPGVRLDIDAELNQLIAQLRTLRDEFTNLPTEGRIDPATAIQLRNLAESLRNTRRLVDNKIRKVAIDLTQPQAIASPGRAQAICLLLESPLLRAAERTDLLERVLPPLKPTQLSLDQLVGVVRSGTGALMLDRIDEQVQREMRVIEFFSGQGLAQSNSQAKENLGVNAANCLKKLRGLIGAGADKKANTPTIGAEFRTFLSQLPQQIGVAAASRKQRTERETARDMFDLYHWLLLVDGRQDGRQLSQAPIYLWQPYLPEPVQDVVRLTMSPPTLQLTETPQELKVSIELITGKEAIKDLYAKLTLQFDSTVLQVVDADNDATTLTERTIQLPGKTWEGKFKVSSKVTGDQQDLPLVAEASFLGTGGRPVKATAKTLVNLPRPNLVDLKVVAEHRYRDDDRLANTETERDQGAELRLFPNRETAMKVLLRNLSSTDKKVRVQLINPMPSERKRLYDEGGTLLTKYRELEEEILAAPPNTLPLTLANRVLASTSDKTPLMLMAAGSPVTPVPLEVAAPANGVAAADVTSGLICLITNVDKPTERYVKWLDLRPYSPDELFRVENLTVIGQDLSFKVKLLSDDLATGMRLDDKPAPVVWDREGTSLEAPNRIESELAPGKLEVTLRGPVPRDRSSVTLRLHIDRYPRAFLYQLQLNEAQVIEQNNLKRNRTVGVHISRLAFEKQAFHIVPRNPAFQPAFEPVVEPPIPDFVLQKLRRGDAREFAGIKLDNRKQQQQLTFDLEADVSTAAFANGATIEVAAQEGQQPLKFYRDRDVKIQLLPKPNSTGVLSFQTSVDDFRGRTILVDADTEKDSRVTLTAAVRNGNDSPTSDALHAVPVVFDRLSPVVVEARLVNPQIDTFEGRPAPPAVIKFTVTDNQGVGVKRVQAMLVPRGVKVEPNPDNIVEFSNPSDGELQLELPVPGDLQPGPHEFRVLLEPVDKVDRVGKKVALDLSVNVRKVPVAGSNKPRTTFGGDTNKQADAIKEAEKRKLIAPPMPPPAGGAGS